MVANGTEDLLGGAIRYELEGETRQLRDSIAKFGVRNSQRGLLLSLKLIEEARESGGNFGIDKRGRFVKRGD